MTEYWKSTPKYYCKTCNTWIADNRVVRFCVTECAFDFRLAFGFELLSCL